MTQQELFIRIEKEMAQRAEVKTGGGNPRKFFELGFQMAVEIPETGMIGVFADSGIGKTLLIERVFKDFRRTRRCRLMKQDIVAYPHLTLEETIRFYVSLYGSLSSPDDLIRDLRLDSARHTCVRHLSGGQKKRMMLASILADSHAQLLLLDEPFTGLDQTNVTAAFEAIREKARSCCIIFSAHTEFDELWFPLLTSRWHLTDSEQIQVRPDENPVLAASTRVLCCRKLALLSWREGLAYLRRPQLLVVRLCIPLMMVFLQAECLGFLRHHMRDLNDLVTMIRLFTSYEILMFTSSLLPVGFLADHMVNRRICMHEIAQGIYPEWLATLNSLLWEVMFVAVICTLIFFGVMYAPGLDVLPLLVAAWTLFSSMLLSTGMLWTLMKLVPYDGVLLSTTSYFSASFAMNISFLGANKVIWYLAPYLSFAHLQTRLFMKALPQSPTVQAFNEVITRNQPSVPMPWLVSLLVVTVSMVLPFFGVGCT